MGTYHGERFLREQLASIAAQTHRNWLLYVSDDGSTDATRAIINEFAAKQSEGQVVLTVGPRRGFAANFLTALCAAPEADYYAFADQDDIWEPDKLQRALSMLQSVPENRPALYCGRTRLVDAAARPIGFSPAFQRPSSFANALVQNVAGGNTMVMNAATRALVLATGVHLDIVSHDWWTYQLVSGAGGRIAYDLVPKVLYRQHGNNLVGKNNGVTDRLTRIRLLLSGRFSDWTARNIRALKAAQPLLTPENRALLEEFAQIQNGSLVVRFAALRKTRVYRQTMLGNFGLMVAVVFSKV